MTTKTPLEVIPAAALSCVSGGKDDAASYCTGLADGHFVSAVGKLMNPSDPKKAIPDGKLHGEIDGAWGTSREFLTKCNTMAKKGLDAGFNLDQVKPMLDKL